MSQTFSTIKSHNNIATYILIMLMCFGVYDIYTNTETVPLEPRLSLLELDYQDRFIRQSVIAINADHLPALWSAVIYNQVGVPICTGSSNFNYDSIPDIISMTVLTWTDDLHCRLVVGNEYRGLATWSWRNSSNFPRSISGDFTFIYEGEPIL